MRAHTTQLHIPEKKAAALLLCMLVGLIFSYLFLVNQTVRHIVERKQLTATKSTLESQISELEFTYINHKDTITPDRALAHGFIEAEKVTYIDRTPQGSVLTLNQ